MTAIAQPIISRPSPAHVSVKGSRLSSIRTTDHKTIGLMYLTASFVFFGAGGLMAMLIRAELARPGLQFLSPEQYNQLFTMHAADAAHVRDAAVLRVRQPGDADPDRVTGRRVPAAERPGPSGCSSSAV